MRLNFFVPALVLAAACLVLCGRPVASQGAPPSHPKSDRFAGLQGIRADRMPSGRPAAGGARASRGGGPRRAGRSAAADEAWVARYAGPEVDDVAMRMALDTAGNVYVTG